MPPPIFDVRVPGAVDRPHGGRTGTVAACVLVARGDHSADEAIAIVRAVRRGTVQTRCYEVKRPPIEAGGQKGGRLT
jgi:hypothetical protein